MVSDFGVTENDVQAELESIERKQKELEEKGRQLEEAIRKGRLIAHSGNKDCLLPLSYEANVELRSPHLHKMQENIYIRCSKLLCRSSCHFPSYILPSSFSS